MHKQNFATEKLIASACIATLTWIYREFKKGNLTLSVDHGAVVIKKVGKGMHGNLSIPLPDITLPMEILEEFRTKHLT